MNFPLCGKRDDPAELPRIMKQQGWTQSDLARLLPLKSTRSIRYWLSGKRKIMPLVAERIRSLKLIKKDEQFMALRLCQKCGRGKNSRIHLRQRRWN